jgi:hypothetical protein
MRSDLGESNALIIAVAVILCLAMAVAAFVLLDFSSEGEIPQDVSHRPLDETPEADAAEAAPPEDEPFDQEREALAPAEPEKKPGPDAEPVEGKITGRFLDASGLPLLDVRVERDSWRRSPQTEALTHSGPDGRIEIRIAPRDGKGSMIRLSATRPGYARAKMEVVVKPGETSHLGDIVLEPGGALSGRVSDELGAPVAEARVCCCDPELPPHRERDLLRHGPFMTILETRTGPDGRFRMDCIPVGWFRIWAGIEKKQHAFTEPVEVRAGQETFGIELVLEPLPGDSFIEGIVVGPDGEPVPRAGIRCEYRIEGSSGSSSFSAGEDGRFRHVLGEQCPHTVEASDREGRFGPVRIDDVEPGTTGLVLRLTPPIAFRLAVRFEDEGGKGFRITSFRPDEFRTFFSENFQESDLDEDGTVAVPVPMEAFKVKVVASGYHSEEIGPFDPALLPSVPVEVMLRAAPGIRGSVTAGGAPVAGATVTLHEAGDPGGELRVNGFLSRSKPSWVEMGVTDDSGSFLLDLQESGVYYVRAVADGFAPAEAGPHTVDHEVGASGLELKLGAGGAIEGKVLVPSGRSPEGVIVAASRGDGFVQTVRTGPGGVYRFERLIPGRWLVDETEEETGPHGSGYSWRSMDEPSEIPWSCIVEEGKTTYHDLDLTGGGMKCILEGKLLLGGTVPAGWSATVSKRGAIFGTTVIESSIGVDGNFVLEIKEPGAYKLNLNGRTASGAALFVTDEIDVIYGLNTWNRDIAVGRLEVGGAPAPDELDIPLFFKWSDGGGLEAMAEIRPDETGRAVLAAVPAGAGRIVKIVRSKGLGKPGEEVLATVDVPAGGTGYVKLE